jgi:hypothetical protein
MVIYKYCIILLIHNGMETLKLTEINFTHPIVLWLTVANKWNQISPNRGQPVHLGFVSLWVNFLILPVASNR